MKQERILAIINELLNMNEVNSYMHKALWNELYKECIRELHKMVVRRNLNFNACYEQEDFQQEVILNVSSRLSEYNPSRSKFNTWLWRLATTTYYGNYKKCKSQLENNVTTISMYMENEDKEMNNIIDHYKHSSSVEQKHLYNFSSKKLYDAINNLRPNYRDVVILCDIEGLKPREAAKVLGEKKENVYRWLNRAHDNLENFVVEEDLEEDIELEM